MKNPRPPVPPGVALGLAVISASTSSILIRFAQDGASSLAIAVYRLGLAALILLPVLLLRYRSQIPRIGSAELRMIGLSGFFLALHFATWISSLEYTSVASSVVLVQTTPLMVALLSPAILREPVPRTLALGLVVSTIGTLVIGVGDACVNGDCRQLSLLFSDRAIRGDALALAGAAAGAGYVMLGRRVRQEVSLIPYVVGVYGIAAGMLAAAALATGEALSGFDPQTLLYMALLAIFPQLIAHSTYNWALRYLAAAVVSLALLGEPVASTLLAVVYLDETPTILRALGGALVLIGIALATGLSRAGWPVGKRRT